ncbi:MAG: HEAT repeat domain-containing protein [Planctomycetota bacterium]
MSFLICLTLVALLGTLYSWSRVHSPSAHEPPSIEALSLREFPNVEDGSPFDRAPELGQVEVGTSKIDEVQLVDSNAAIPTPTHPLLQDAWLELSEEATARLQDLIGHLADDDLRFNALRAVVSLSGDSSALPLLEDALQSDDYQQRQLAATILRRSGLSPSDLLLEVTVEGLHNDEMHVHNTVANARDGLAYLRKHVKAAREHLVAALTSADEQQAFLSAYLLGWGRQTIGLPRACDILIEHLADNNIPDDACLSCQALYRLGKAAVPFLQEQQHSSDRQQRDLVQLLLLNINEPTTDPEELQARYRLNRITTLDWDPCVSTRHRATPGIDNYNLWGLTRKVLRHAKNPYLRQLREQYGAKLVMKVDYKEFDHRQIAVGVWEGYDFVRLLTLQLAVDGTLHRLDSSGAWVRDWDGL